MKKLLRTLHESVRKPLILFVIITAFVSIALFADIFLYRKWVEVNRRAIEEKSRLRSIITTGMEYIVVKNEVEDIVEYAFKGNGTAMSEIDAIVTRAGLKKNLSSLKPITTAVTDRIDKIKAELLMEKISIFEVSVFLDFVEANAHAIGIEKLSLKSTYETPALYNVSIVLNYVESK